MRIGLLYCDTRSLQRGTAADGLPDQDAEAVTPAIQTLERLGHEVVPRGITFEDLDRLHDELVDCAAVFNLCDGSGVDGAVGPGAPALLEQLGLPYTGCSTDPYLLSVDKAQVHRALEAAGVPVPEGRVFGSEDRLEGFAPPWPVIVKPREGYGSLGIDHRSVVTDPVLLPAAIRRARLAGDGDVLVERYLPGRELSVGVIGAPGAPLLLPAVEFRFQPVAGRLPIRTLSSKHDPTSPEYLAVDVAPAGLDAATERAVEAAVRGAWSVLGGDGYGRVDLRLDEDGAPKVIEVNANCSLEIGPTACDCSTMVLAARLAGWDEAVLFQRILDAGWERARVGGPASIRAPVSGRWTAGLGHSLHTLRPVAEGEELASLDGALLAGRGSRRPWRIAGEWLLPDPPYRWARAAPSALAGAVVEERDGRRVLRTTKALPRFSEVRVAARAMRRGPAVHLHQGVP